MDDKCSAHKGKPMRSCSCMIASITVFGLAVFQVIPKRKHIVTILLLLGGVSVSLGCLAAYWNFHALIHPFMNFFNY